MAGLLLRSAAQLPQRLCQCRWFRNESSTCKASQLSHRLDPYFQALSRLYPIARMAKLDLLRYPLVCIASHSGCLVAKHHSCCKSTSMHHPSCNNTRGCRGQYRDSFPLRSDQKASNRQVRQTCRSLTEHSPWCASTRCFLNLTAWDSSFLSILRSSLYHL